MNELFYQIIWLKNKGLIKRIHEKFKFLNTDNNQYICKPLKYGIIV
jgi:hypothetical protein